MIRWEDMVLNSDIVLIVTILIQNHIIGVLFIQLLQERKPSLQVLILLPRNVLGKVLMPQSVKVDLLIPQDLVLNLVNNLVDIELIIVVKLIVPVLVEFNQPIIHFRGVSLQKLPAVFCFFAPVLSVTGNLIGVKPDLKLRELFLDLLDMAISTLHDHIVQVKDQLFYLMLVCLLEVSFLEVPSVLIRVNRGVSHRILISVFNQMHPFEFEISRGPLHRLLIATGVLIEESPSIVLIFVQVVQITPQLRECLLFFLFPEL